MARPTLDDLTDRLDQATVGSLGDPVTYQDNQWGPSISITGFVDAAELARDFGQSASVADDLSIKLRVSDVPARPTRDARITITRTGLIYKPVEVLRDASGRWWSIQASRVSA